MSDAEPLTSLEALVCIDLTDREIEKAKLECDRAMRRFDAARDQLVRARARLDAASDACRHFVVSYERAKQLENAEAWAGVEK